MKINKFFHLVLASLLILLVLGCSQSKDSKRLELPLPEADDSSQFGIDKNINQETIDNYLDRDDVYYRDVRMLFDPAQYSDIGGEADLTSTIRGFKIIPYPFIGSLGSLPVANAYSGDKLFDVEWTSDGHVIKAVPLYSESLMILEEVFPKDRAIFLMCGGGGYANMTKQLLIYLGWDKNKLYNVGANWTYKGKNSLELVLYPENINDSKTYATWRADYTYIDFSKLNPIQN